jgi:putative Holliday junction resolvase
MSAKDVIFNTPRELVSKLTKDARLLGVDLGSKTIGLAISDPLLQIASPIHTLKRTKLHKNAIEFSNLIKEYRIGGLIVGLPINMDGTEGPRAQATRDWTLDLVRMIEVAAAFWDERLSTAAVERMMLTADMTRKKRALKIDQAAAAYILQGALDAVDAQKKIALTDHQLNSEQ